MHGILLTFSFFSFFNVVAQVQPVPDTMELEEVEIRQKSSTNSLVVSRFSMDNGQKLQCTTLLDMLSFGPGVRTESDCQTCNYTQVRINGLSGSYSQILINGRPLFSSLFSLYGLEQIPIFSIAKVEVTKGSAPVTAGSHAIAGTLSVTTRVPQSLGIAYNQVFQHIKGGAYETTEQFSSAIPINNKQIAVAFSASKKNRMPSDQNGDGFSELPMINGTTLGVTVDCLVNSRLKLYWNCYGFHEIRRGGNAFDVAPELSDQCEFRKQLALISQVNASWKSKDETFSLSVYAGAQHIQRIHYTGIAHANGWGTTHALTFQFGAMAQKQWNFRKLRGAVIVGMEQLKDTVRDEILAYNYLVQQNLKNNSWYTQLDCFITKKWSLQVGTRLTKHPLVQQILHTPRCAFTYKWNSQWSTRFTVGSGKRAPQAFETDLHIAFAGGGISKISIDPQLKCESAFATYYGIMWNRQRKLSRFEATIESFYTRISHPFVLREVDGNLGEVSLLRTNGSTVRYAGVTLSSKWKRQGWFHAEGSFTTQLAKYAMPNHWSLEVDGTKHQLRTPWNYGYLQGVLFPDGKWNAIISLTFTGKMEVPHFGGAPEQPQDELVKTPCFYDVGMHFQRQFHWHKLEQSLAISAGVSNVLNSYQSDFDTTKFRDSNYTYGPSKPRCFSISIQYQLGKKHD